MKEILVVSRIKNNRLFRTIMSQFESIIAFCRNNNINEQNIYALINLRIAPFNRDHRPTPLAQKIEGILGKPFEFLFPSELYARLLSVHHAKTLAVHIEMDIKSARAIAMRGLSFSQELGVDSRPLELALARDVIKKQLLSLNQREQMVIDARYGISTRDDGRTCDEIGKKLKITGTRVRQIEAKAIRKLRHPSLSKSLRGYCD